MFAHPVFVEDFPSVLGVPCLGILIAALYIAVGRVDLFLFQSRVRRTGRALDTPGGIRIPLTAIPDVLLSGSVVQPLISFGRLKGTDGSCF